VDIDRKKLMVRKGKGGNPHHLDQRQAEPYQKGICPHFKTATVVTLEIIPTRGPPQKKSSIKIFENKTE